MKAARAEKKKDIKSHGNRHREVRCGTKVAGETKNEVTGYNGGKLCKETEEQAEKRRNTEDMVTM